jgi:uncharacterized membrane protein
MSSWLGHVIITCLICLILLLIVIFFLWFYYLKHKKDDEQKHKGDKYLEDSVESKPKEIACKDDQYNTII